MLYKRRSFSVSAVTLGSSAPRGAQCAEKGHSGRDSKGRCYSCGERIAEPPVDVVLEVIRDPRLEAIDRDYLDEPCVRILGPASSIKTHGEMVNLEGGPAGDIAVPAEELHAIPGSTNCLYAYEYRGELLLYRPIGVDDDRPRLFAFDGEGLGHTIVE